MALRKTKFLTKPRPFSFTIWARAATTTLSICVFEGQLATHRLQRRHLPRISRHFGRKLLLALDDELRQVVLAPGHGGLHSLLLVDGTEEAAEAALHALVRVLLDFLKLAEVFHAPPP